MTIITNELGQAIGTPATPLVVAQSAGALQPGATFVLATSGNVAAAAAAATMPAVAAKTNYLSGFEVTGGGATAASIILVTVTGLLGGTRVYSIAVPAGVTLGVMPLVCAFFPALPASAVNIAITVSAASFGAGNTNAVTNLEGYVA